jgi:hypothetical protein
VSSALIISKNYHSRDSYTSNAVAYSGILLSGGSTNSVEDTGQREQGSGGGSPLVRVSAQFAYK